MYVKTVVIPKQVMLNTANASNCKVNHLIHKANSFTSILRIKMGLKEANAKSLIGLLSMNLVGGSIIELIGNGRDEKQAVDSLIELLTSAEN